MNGDLPYRLNVGIVVFNKAGQVWLGKRYVPGDDCSAESRRVSGWQFPQGGVDEGETLADAARRELYEETGIKKVELLGSYDEALYYDFPNDLLNTKLAQSFKGQKQYWFAFSFYGHDSEIMIAPPPDGHAQEFSEWCWTDLAIVLEKVVSFKQSVYNVVITAFNKHVNAVNHPKFIEKSE